MKHVNVVSVAEKGLERGNKAPFTREEIARLRLFRSVEIEPLDPMLKNCSVEALAPGQVLIEAGKRSKVLYLILAGQLSIHVESPETDPIEILDAGESVGEISVIDRKPASAYVVASTPSRVLIIDEDLMWLLVESSHPIANNLLHTLATRLRHGNNVIEEDRKRLREYRFHATIDAVTGLFNRHWLRKMLPRQMARSNRCSESLTILMIDIDHFKQFNDSYGHVAGDCALKIVADCVRDTVRPTDMVTRYGGEEFLVLLPAASADNGVRVGERLRNAVSSKTIVCDEGPELPAVTISIGVAQMPQDCTPEAFIDRADAALYRAKLSGRDRVSE